MSEALTPNGVVVHLGSLARELEKATDELGEAEREAIHAKEAYRKARDTAFLKAEAGWYGKTSHQQTCRLCTGAKKSS